MFEPEEFTKEFLLECHESLRELDVDLVALENAPGDAALLDRILRAVHSVKGTAGVLGYRRVEALAHAGESLLCLVREGALPLTSAMITACLELLDALRAVLLHVEKRGDEGTEPYTSLIARLHGLAGLEPPQAAPAAPAPAAAPSPRTADGTGGARTAAAPAPSAPPTAPLPTMAPSPPAPTPAPISAAVAASAAVVARGSGPGLPARPAAPAESRSAAPDTPVGAPHPTHLADEQAGGEGSSMSDRSVRVAVELLDELVDQVGELVLLRNRVLQVTSDRTGGVLQSVRQSLTSVTTRIQQGVMRTRMQPIGYLWQKLPRLVRDLSLSCGKQVALRTEGAETEVDRGVLEALWDPIMHLVRNALAHGLETPEERRRQGKPEEGRLLLKAYHEGGYVQIVVEDDGAGIDMERLVAKAISGGFVTGEQASRLGERELMDLLFLPGFSTAREVTSLSGRGVGLDVVKTNVERVGGTLDLRSRRGQGVTLRMRLPLTLAIVPAILLRNGAERFAIPHASVLELVGLFGEHGAAAVELVGDAPFFRLRSELIPLVRLDGLLGLESRPPSFIVVLQAADQRFGLLVEDVIDNEEVVVKALSRRLRELCVYAGATVLGDGKVALILDVAGLAGQARLEQRARSIESRAAAATPEAERVGMLVVAGPRGGRLALPLAAVARLEEVRAQQVEQAGSRRLLQYRGRILPLVLVAEALGDAATVNLGTRERWPVIVYESGSTRVGLVVDEIVDAFEAALDVRGESTRPGVAFTTVIEGRITEVLDVEALVAAAAPTSATRLLTHARPEMLTHAAPSS